MCVGTDSPRFPIGIPRTRARAAGAAARLRKSLCVVWEREEREREERFSSIVLGWIMCA